MFLFSVNSYIPVCTEQWTKPEKMISKRTHNNCFYSSKNARTLGYDFPLKIHQY
jgi:hypothetical protein